MQEWFLCKSHKHDIIIASTYVTQVYMRWTIATIFCVYMHVCVAMCLCVCVYLFIMAYSNQSLYRQITCFRMNVAR